MIYDLWWQLWLWLANWQTSGLPLIELDALNYLQCTHLLQFFCVSESHGSFFLPVNLPATWLLWFHSGKKHILLFLHHFRAQKVLIKLATFAVALSKTLSQWPSNQIFM